MTHDEKPAVHELTTDDLRRASGGVANIPGVTKSTNVTLKRGVMQ